MKYLKYINESLYHRSVPTHIIQHKIKHVSFGVNEVKKIRSLVKSLEMSHAGKYVDGRVNFPVFEITSEGRTEINSELFIYFSMQYANIFLLYNFSVIKAEDDYYYVKASVEDITEGEDKIYTVSDETYHCDSIDGLESLIRDKITDK
jgi:hypothetical protein